ncbi:hypothetical protein IGJ99_001072 [Enterococcus sp. AZ095b]
MGVVAEGKMTNNFHYYNVPLKTHKKIPMLSMKNL